MGTAGREASAVVPRDTRAEGLLEDRLVVQRLNQRECCHAWEVRFNRQTFIQSARLPMNAKLPPALSNRQLLTALSHPTRTHLLMTLSERIETPKNLAGELGCPIRHVEYHLGVLEDLSCVELVKTEESPGGKVLAHYYRATERLWFDREAWKVVDDKGRPSITMGILGNMSEDLTKALLADTIDEGENHISRTPAILDETGYEQLLVLLSDNLDRIVGIQAESANRLEDGGVPIMTKIHLVQFISPDPK